MTFARIASRVKPRPVRFTVILFDGTRPTILPFIGKLPRKPTPEFTPSEMRRIDRARSEAYFDALDLLGEAGATEYAATRAEETATNLRMSRQIRGQAAQERRAPYTSEDCRWWFECGGEPDWDRMAGERLAGERLTAGIGV